MHHVFKPPGGSTAKARQTVERIDIITDIHILDLWFQQPKEMIIVIFSDKVLVLHLEATKYFRLI